MREEFKEWLSDKLAPTSQVSYINGLDNLGGYLGREIDIWNVTDINKLDELDSELTELKNGELDPKVADYWNDRRSFIRKYLEFIGDFLKTRHEDMRIINTKTDDQFEGESYYVKFKKLLVFFC
jgi:hypothetical protein